MRQFYFRLILVLLTVLTLPAIAQRKMVHPGISYTQADIDRMKAMIAAKQEPFYSAFERFKVSHYVTYGDYDYPLPKASNGEPVIWENRQHWLDNFGRIALANALMWKLTDDNTYADKAVKTLNRYNGVHSTITYGTNCLDNSAATPLIEAAELIRDYSGWKAEDQQAFKDFLVYPGYSSKEDYYEKYATSDTLTNKVTIYWNIFQGDPGRHGNQGLYGMRCLMAMGIYLDNDTIYERALRKVLSQPHLSYDLPYPYGPRRGVLVASSMPDYYQRWSQNAKKGELTIGNIPDYGSDDELKWWIYDNGQCQESSRDQGHVMDGMCNMTDIAQVAWNQGDDIFSAYNERLFKGIVFSAKYNYGCMR
ncbi:MAG: alginate lyase family protein [Prevotella sp.]